MTNIEALKAKLSYPLADNAFTLALTNRGLVDSATYAASSAAFELAYADTIFTLVTAPNTSEGGYSISLTDRKALIDLANGIYAANGIVSPLLKPTAKFVHRW